MAVGNSTLGIKVYYAVEETAGVRPTSLADYTEIVGVKEIPGIGEEASAIDVTPLAEREFRQYVAGLKDSGGTVQFTSNNTNEFQAAWAGLVEVYELGRESDLDTWFCVTHPYLDNAFYFTGEPVNLGLSSASVNEAMNANANVIAGKVDGWLAKPA